MPNLAAAILAKRLCHDAPVHGSWQEGGDHVRGRPQMGDTTMKLYKKQYFKKYTASLNRYFESF